MIFHRQSSHVLQSKTETKFIGFHNLIRIINDQLATFFRRHIVIFLFLWIDLVATCQWKEILIQNTSSFGLLTKFEAENRLRFIKIARKIAKKCLKLIKTYWNYESLWVIWNEINEYYEGIVFQSCVNSGSFMMIFGMFSQILWWNLLFSSTF